MSTIALATAVYREIGDTEVRIDLDVAGDFIEGNCLGEHDVTDLVATIGEQGITNLETGTEMHSIHYPSTEPVKLRENEYREFRKQLLSLANTRPERDED